MFGLLPCVADGGSESVTKFLGKKSTIMEQSERRGSTTFIIQGGGAFSTTFILI